MGAQSSKTARRSSQPLCTVRRHPRRQARLFGAIQLQPQLRLLLLQPQQPIQQQQSDSPEIDAATKENFHKMNCQSKQRKWEADFKKVKPGSRSFVLLTSSAYRSAQDNEMLSILRSRKAAAVKANAQLPSINKERLMLLISKSIFGSGSRFPKSMLIELIRLSKVYGAVTVRAKVVWIRQMRLDENGNYRHHVGER
ncbi:hypothetical protein BCR33DRAFT_163610 [Rhizoclosmatium globosum]|uniref:Uncharacterized protein n=1 Tax=Rhizoclosmatium globosum TaxID=329046 RepID=A0A1Y2AIC4_9FUNG|nr:hypothetical protein BCR33DRAFT_163610 [Rhizoclosmatium globosum]|eukprot:ORY22266.1 hypothetical protein BCR33DRAFT_163610 [Rhizoclosmatium globosum]